MDNNTSKPSLDSLKSNLKSYVLNPALSDTLCRSAVIKAKSEISNGKFVYVQEAGLGFGYKRYEAELKSLCKEKGLGYEVDFLGCVINEGQTQGCYKAFMDEALIDKFGSNFKENLNRQADSLFLIRIIEEKTPIHSWDCDEEPKPFLDIKSYLERTIQVSDLDLKRTETTKTWPAIDLSFIIEIDGTISNFYSDNYISNVKHNEKFKNQLYNIAVKYIKDNYPRWQAGKVNNTSVITDHNLRITFIGEI